MFFKKQGSRLCSDHISFTGPIISLTNSSSSLQVISEPRSFTITGWSSTRCWSRLGRVHSARRSWWGTKLRGKGEVAGKCCHNGWMLALFPWCHSESCLISLQVCLEEDPPRTPDRSVPPISTPGGMLILSVQDLQRKFCKRERIWALQGDKRLCFVVGHAWLLVRKQILLHYHDHKTCERFTTLLNVHTDGAHCKSEESLHCGIQRGLGREG